MKSRTASVLTMGAGAVTLVVSALLLATRFAVIEYVPAIAGAGIATGVLGILFGVLLRSEKRGISLVGLLVFGAIGTAGTILIFADSFGSDEERRTPLTIVVAGALFCMFILYDEWKRLR